MKTKTIERYMEQLEKTNFRMDRAFHASLMNQILEEIGGEPSTVDMSAPGMRDGSYIEQWKMYCFLVVLKNMINKVNGD